MTPLAEAVGDLIAEDPDVRGDGEVRPLSSFGTDADGWCGYVEEVVTTALASRGFSTRPAEVETGIPFLSVHYVTVVETGDGDFVVDLTASQLPGSETLRDAFPLVIAAEDYCEHFGFALEESS